MRIKKISQTTPTASQVVDGYSTSTKDAYSCKYVNNLYETATTLLNWTSIGSGSSAEYSLDDDMTKYKYLYILFSGSGTDDSGSAATSFVITSLFKNLHDTKALSTIYDMGDSGYYARIKYKTDTSVNAWASAQLSPIYVKIIGLN